MGQYTPERRLVPFGEGPAYSQTTRKGVSVGLVFQR